MTLFIDMDGVVFDFDNHFEQSFGHRAEDELTKEDMWATIAKKPNFFITMPMMPGAAHFLAQYGYRNPVFITHVPNNDFGLTFEDITNQKKMALQQNGYGGLVIPVPGRPHLSKAHYMQRPGDILVDDWKRNIAEWEAAGGKGILHRDFTTTAAELEWHLYRLSHPNTAVS